MSVPIVFIPDQASKIKASAVIFWDNAFSEINRSPFAVVDQVEWSELSGALKKLFHCVTGRSLNDEHLTFLCKYCKCTFLFIYFIAKSWLNVRAKKRADGYELNI